jgi:hypothetical protein
MILNAGEGMKGQNIMQYVFGLLFGTTFTNLKYG